MRNVWGSGRGRLTAPNSNWWAELGVIELVARKAGTSTSTTLYNNVLLSATKLRCPVSSRETASAEEAPDHERLHHPHEVSGRRREREGTTVYSQGDRRNKGPEGELKGFKV